MLATVLLAGGSVASAKPVVIGGPFDLVAADGATVTDATYRGRWMLVVFGYTFCPDVCPTTLNVVAEALDRLGADAESLRPLFITVDPARDTPDVVGAYAAAFDARIVGLTGTPDQVAAAANAYRARYAIHAADPTDRFYVVDHSSTIYVVDPDGAFVRALDFRASGEALADALRAMIRRR